MEVHSLRCYNCGGRHKASKRMEMRAILTANDPAGRGAESSQVLGRWGPHFKQDRNKKVKCISKRQARYVDRASKQVNVHVGDSVN